MTHNYPVRFILLFTCVFLLLVGCRQEPESPEPVLLTQPFDETVPGIDQPAIQPVAQPVEQPVLQFPPAPSAQGVTFSLAESTLIGATGTAAAAGGAIQHQVNPGEWLVQISRCYGTDYPTLRWANPQLVNPDLIYPQTSIITVPDVGSEGAVSGPPCVQFYTVQPGDTWEALAQTFQTTAVILQKANPGALIAGRSIVVPTVGSVAGLVPSLSHDLLFVYGGSVSLWRSSDRRVEVLNYPEGQQATVTDVTSNALGDLILARQARPSLAQTEIALINLNTRAVTILEDGITTSFPVDPAKENMLVSPDGQWGVVLIPEAGGLRINSYSLTDTAVRHTLSVPHGAHDLIAPQLFMGSDGDHFLLLDASGVYEYDYALSEAERQLYAILGDGSGGPDDPLSLRATAWAPAGRYLLLEGNYIEGGASFVLDAESGFLKMVPNSSSYVTIATAAWRADGALAVLAPADPPPGPRLTQFEVTASETDLTLPSLLDTTLTPAEGTAVPAGGPGFLIDTPSNQPFLDRIQFIIQGSDGSTGLWTVPDAAGPTMNRIRTLPTNAGYNALWLPDGSGVLLHPGPDASVTYATADDTPAFSLSNWLGAAISDFQWVIP